MRKQRNATRIQSSLAALVNRTRVSGNGQNLDTVWMAILVLAIGLCAEFGAPPAMAQATTAPVREIDPYLAQQLTSTMKFLLLSTLLLLVFFVGAYLIVRSGRSVKKRAAKPAAPTPYIDAWAHYRISQDEIDQLTKEDAGPEDQPKRE